MQQCITYEEAKAIYKIGEKSLSQIQKEFGWDRHKLSNLLKSEGISISIKNKKYENKDDFFDHIDTEEKDYWLGFLYADGYVVSTAKGQNGATRNRSCLELTLAEKDKHHVEKFRDLISPQKDLRKKISFKKDGSSANQYRFEIDSVRIVNALVSKGCENNKSFTLQFPDESKIPSHLMRHFLRGVVDGDGCLAIYGKVAYWGMCTGSLNFANSFAKFLKHKIPGYRETVHKDKRSTLYTVRTGGTVSVSNIVSYLYKDATVYLERKYELYEKIVNLWPCHQEIDDIIRAELSVETVKP